MLTYPTIDPVAVSIGPLQVHWYGLMYLVAFLTGWWLGVLRTRRPGTAWRAAEISDLVFYFALGAVLGGRIGYTLFYNLGGFLADPLVIFRIWQGGMSYHGGMLGVFVAMWLYARHTGRTFFLVTDFLAPLVPIGLGAGRLGNFINGELWGRPTDLPWGMVFPFVDAQPRHPSMLYELLLEGVLLFVILWLYSRKPRPTMAISGLYLICYGVFRFVVEFLRMPDAQIGYLAFNWLTMGQILSLPMIIIGLIFYVYAMRRTDGQVSW
jgi:phosphatidylglycerol---prolipoprotein diacylglyceryl transferase